MQTEVDASIVLGQQLVSTSRVPSLLSGANLREFRALERRVLS